MMRRCLISLIITSTLLVHACFGNATCSSDDALATLATSSNVRFTTMFFGQGVTPDAIFGSSSSNEPFTFGQGAGPDVRIHAKVPYPRESVTSNAFTYANSAGYIRNFDDTVTSDSDGSFELNIDDLTFLPGIDCNPDLNTTFLPFDPLTSTEGHPFLRQTVGNDSNLDNHRAEATNADRFALHRHTNKEFTLSVRRISNLPSAKVWVLFLCMSFET
ncbi:MAG: hypothetical protein GY809_05930 [Planctomycetes bacterium]|nr:hypothetical protein [Planctomycetota bacterium]